MELTPIHRVVTGYSADGRSIVSAEGVPPTVLQVPEVPGTSIYEIWSTAVFPVPIDNGADPTVGSAALLPGKSGTCIRVVDMPPDDASGAPAAVASLHRTETVDYIVVLTGELTMILDDAEVRLRPGSVVVQRGTNHAWANRTGETCRVLFVMLDGQFEPALASILAPSAGGVPKAAPPMLDGNH